MQNLKEVSALDKKYNSKVMFEGMLGQSYLTFTTEFCHSTMRGDTI